MLPHALALSLALLVTLSFGWGSEAATCIVRVRRGSHVFRVRVGRRLSDADRPTCETNSEISSVTQHATGRAQRVPEYFDRHLYPIVVYMTQPHNHEITAVNFVYCLNKFGARLVGLARTHRTTPSSSRS